MVETYQEQQTEEERLVFEPDQQVSTDELRRIVAPQNTRDPVEEMRLELVSGHVSELLRSDLPPQEANLHKNFIHNLGAEAVMAYIPRR